MQRNYFIWVTTLVSIIGISCQSLAQENVSRIIIQNGLVLTGLGSKPIHASIRIVGDRIAAIGHLKPLPGERIINARGYVVAPGFIDTHSHADSALAKSPLAENHIRQGITTVIVGQDGSSQYPLSKYFATLRSHPVAVNVASFVGHGTVRKEVLQGDFKRVATPDETEKMQKLISQEMTSGAMGLSSGLEYDPGFYSDTMELIECAKAAAQYDGIYISHVRNEDNQAFGAFNELITIARESKIPAQISHIKLGSKSVWGKADQVLEMMTSARKSGLDISADVYPYLFWQSSITVLIPTRDWKDRSLWAKGLVDIGGPEHVLLTSYSPNKQWAHKTIEQIARETGKDAITVIQEIVSHTHGPDGTGTEGVVVTAMTEGDLRTFLKDPNIMICSDGMPGGPHPRAAGSFPRILSRYVRETKLLSPQEAIHKMTSLPAKRMGIRDRGLLKVGNKADIVLINLETVKDTATVDNPTAVPKGIPTVIVNGVVVLDNFKMTGRKPGTPILHKGH